MEEKKSSFDWKAWLVSPLGKAAMIIVLYFAIMGLAYVVLVAFEGVPVVAVIMAIAFGYFGWQALSRITPNVFLIMPVGGWIAYYIVKGLLSFFLGVFVAPFVIAKKVTTAIQNNLS